MYPDMRHEQVVYQNPFLAMRIWQIDVQVKLTQERLRAKEQGSLPFRPSDWHYHEEVEFLLMLEGELTCFHRNGSFEIGSGGVALFGSSEPHLTIPTKEGELSYIVFQIDLGSYWDSSTLGSMRHFSEVIRPLSALNYIYQTREDVRQQSAALIRDIYREINEAQIGYELAVSARIKALLLLLLRHDTEKMLSYNDNLLFERMRPVIEHTEANLCDKLAVADMCDMVNMSYTHFIKTFKKAVGMSFTDFVVFKRIKRAEQLLLTTPDSIADIAEAVGISNLGHFYELFRRANGCSPKQFKDRLRSPAG